MTPLWAIFSFLNFWWIAVFIVIAVQGQRTDNLKNTIWQTSLLSAAITALVSIFISSGIIRFG